MEIIQFLKFFAVGVFVTLVDFVSFWIILNVFEKLKIKHIFNIRIATICNIFAFLVANATSYVLNTVFTFSNSKTNRGIVPYFMVSVFSLSISTFIFQTLTSQEIYTNLNSRFFKGKLNNKQFALVVKSIVVFVTMVTNYVGYKYLVF